MNALNELMCVIAKLHEHIIQDHSGHIQLGTVAATIVIAALNSSSKGSNLFHEKLHCRFLTYWWLTQKRGSLQSRL